MLSTPRTATAHVLSHRSEAGAVSALFLTVQAATSRGLDFIVITDHNTISAR